LFTFVQVIEGRLSPLWPELDLKIDTKILPEVTEIPAQVSVVLFY
jgi:hypothetical protein